MLAGQTPPEHHADDRIGGDGAGDGWLIPARNVVTRQREASWRQRVDAGERSERHGRDDPREECQGDDRDRDLGNVSQVAAEIGE